MFCFIYQYSQSNKRKSQTALLPHTSLFICCFCFASSSIYLKLFYLIICKCLVWLISSLESDRIQPTAGKQVTVKMTSTCDIWAENTFQGKGACFIPCSSTVLWKSIFVPAKCLREVTTPGKETQIFNSLIMISLESWRRKTPNKSNTVHVWLPLFVCVCCFLSRRSAVTYNNKTVKLLSLFSASVSPRC